MIKCVILAHFIFYSIKANFIGGGMMIHMIIGLFIGGCIGTFAMCLCKAAARIDDNEI